MKFQSSQVIPFDVDRVFCVVRDDLQNLVPFMPNVKKIEVESVDNPGEGRIKLVNRWYGKGEIPKMIQKIIQPEMLTWLDTAVWDEMEKTCQWEIKTMFFQDHVSCQGINTYKPEGKDKTRLDINGDLTVQTKGFPGIPKLLEKKASGQIEKFIVKLLSPNFASLATGVTQYLNT